MGNKNLRRAKKTKNDEFYTQLGDIENELMHYKDQFRGKVVFCNCDDPAESNFWLYFKLNFKHLKLKKLISTHYDPEQPTYKLEYDGQEVVKTKLEQNGDFRSPESIELLKQSDIICTNPPFSLFREYFAQLIEYKKEFLIIGNQNALTYKEIFPFIKNNKAWLGYHSGAFKFRVPDDFERKNIEVDERGRRFAKFGNIVWFTNLDVAKRHEEIILYRKYEGNESEYHKYDNYDAINIDRVANIPYDYDGVMGVPITFMNKYNPNQFKIIGLGISSSGLEVGVQPYKDEYRKYRREVQKRGAVDGDLYMVNNGVVKVPYARILIQRKEIGNEDYAKASNY